MGGGHTEETQLKGIQLQTSSYGLPIPLVYGTARLSANLIWYGNFQAIPHETSSGGKGGGFTSTSYTYKVAAMLGLCEGQITGIGSVWKGKDQSDLATLGLSLFTGTSAQTTWSWLTGYAVPGALSSLYGISFASLENLLGYRGQATYNPEALNYSGTAYLAASNYDLGNTTSIPNHGFEIKGLKIFGGTVFDADPSEVISDFLTNGEYGAGFSADWLGPLDDYSNYCLANGLFISPAISAQQAAADLIKGWADATNIALVWSEGVLKFIPYGDTATAETINGTAYSYNPNTTPLYDLTDDDFIGDNSEDPIQVDRVTPADAFNRVQIEYLNRANQYNSEVVDVKDQRDIELYGLRTQPSITLDFICSSDVAKKVAQLMLQRALYIRNSYTFQLGWKYAVLEPMDLVTLTDPALGLDKTAVRIIEISEDEDGLLTVVSEDFPLGAASATLYPHADGIRYQARINDSPSDVAAPLFFEAPGALTTTGLQVWAAVGGQPSDALYGGTSVWLSLDGTNYKNMGRLYGSSRYGTTTATYGSHAAGMDTSHTLSLVLSTNGQLNSASTADATAGTSLIAVGQEYVGFTDATLTGTQAYDLTSINRGLYSTIGASHAPATPWARIDSAIGKSDNLAMSMVGQTVYFKFTAFNIYGGGEQPLSSVTAYTYDITGYMTSLPPSDVASLSALVDAALNITLSWPAVFDLDIGSYEIRDGASWATALVIGAVKGTTFKIPLVSGSHTYQIKAIDVNGNYSVTPATTSLTVSTSSAVTSLDVTAVTITGSAGTQSPALDISWTAANSAILQSTAVEYKKSSDSDWIAYSNVTPPATSAQIVGIEPATSYDVRVAELYNNSIKSAYATVSSVTSASAQTVFGATAAPWSGITGSDKPADNATQNLSGNLLIDASFATPGWSIAAWGAATPAFTGGGWGTSPSDPLLAANVAGTDTSTLCYPIAYSPVLVGQNLFAQVRAAMGTGTDGDIVFMIYWYDYARSYISRDIVYTDHTVSVGGVFQDYTLDLAPPTGAMWFKPVIGRETNTSHSGYWHVGLPWCGFHAPGATVGAPTGTKVGTSTDAGDIETRVTSGLTTGTGVVANNKVQTSSIIDANVNKVSVVELASDTFITRSVPTSPTWTTLLTLTFTKDIAASSILVKNIMASYVASTNLNFVCLLYLDGTLIKQCNGTTVTVDAYSGLATVMSDLITGMSAGSHTFRVDVTTGQGSGSYVRKGALLEVLEIKK